MKSTPVRGFASLALCALCLVARSAHADCAVPDRFAEAARATRVAVVRVSATGSGFAATLDIEDTLSGPRAPARITAHFNPMSGPSFQRGGRYLVFLDAAGNLAGGCATLDVASPGGAAERTLLHDWLAARDVRARVGVLLQHGLHAHVSAASAALEHLAASPDLLASVTTAERATLVAAVPNVREQVAEGLARTLARLHAIESLPAWIEFLAHSHGGVNHRPIQAALEFMTNHHDPLYTPGRDFDAVTGAQLREHWIAWQRAHARDSSDQAVAAGFRERGASAPALSDRAALATAACDARDDLGRSVAVDRCEQIAASVTTRLRGPDFTVDASDAAVACGVSPLPTHAP